MSLRTKALIAIFVAALLWSSSATVPKLLFHYAPPFTVAFQRFAIASILIFPFFIRIRKPKQFFRTLLPLGLFNGLNIIFYYSGLSLTTANTASILGTAVPLTTMIISSILIGETVQKHKLTGIIIGLIGALFIVLLPIFGGNNLYAGNIYGNLLLVGSELSWTLYIVYSRSILSKGSFSPVLSTSINIFMTTALTGLAAIFFGQPLVTGAIGIPSYLLPLLFIAICLTLITFFLFQWAVQHVSATTASLKEYIQLVFGVIINSIVLGERITGSFIIGGVLVVLGVIMATRHNISKQTAAALFNQGD